MSALHPFVRPAPSFSKRCSLFFPLIGVLIGACGGSGGTPNDDRDVDPAYYTTEYGTTEYGDEAEDVISDGTYSATVDYYNPETGYMSTYDLDVEVEGGEVTTVYFPDGGWLDDTQAYSGELDEDGRATLEAYDGRTFEIQIDP